MQHFTSGVKVKVFLRDLCVNSEALLVYLSESQGNLVLNRKLNLKWQKVNMVKIIMRIVLDQKYSWTEENTYFEAFINHFKAYGDTLCQTCCIFQSSLIDRNDFWRNCHIWFDNNNRDSPVKKSINIKQHLRRFHHPLMKQKVHCKKKSWANLKV